MLSWIVATKGCLETTTVKSWYCNDDVFTLLHEKIYKNLDRETLLCDKYSSLARGMDQVNIGGTRRRCKCLNN